jgi:hypothetical protein
MTIEYKGIRRKTTDVLSDYSQAHYLQNARLKRIGEMGRRAGLGKSTMAQLAGPVQFMIGGWNYEPFIVNGTGGDVTGNSDPLVFWTIARVPPPPPPPPPPPGCTLWGPFGDNGTDNSGTWTFTLPAGSCPGTFIVTAIEGGGSSGGSGASGDYGYSFDVTADGVPILNTACLVNDGAAAVIPAGTISLQYIVTASCVGGLIPGTWSVSATSP